MSKDEKKYYFDKYHAKSGKLLFFIWKRTQS